MHRSLLFTPTAAAFPLLAALALAGLFLAAPGAAQEEGEGKGEARIASLQEAQVPLQEAAAVRQENFRGLNRQLRALFAMTRAGTTTKARPRASWARLPNAPRRFRKASPPAPSRCLTAKPSRPCVTKRGRLLAKAYALGRCRRHRGQRRLQRRALGRSTPALGRRPCRPMHRLPPPLPHQAVKGRALVKRVKQQADQGGAEIAASACPGRSASSSTAPSLSPSPSVPLCAGRRPVNIAPMIRCFLPTGARSPASR